MSVEAKPEIGPEQPVAETPAVPEEREQKNGNHEVSALDKKLIRQVEFYFGDYNLHRDKFMQEHIKQNEGWFDMNTMLKFQRLSSLCSEPGTILAALKNSKNNLVEVDIDSMSIRRNPNRPVPENNAKYARDLVKRSVYIKGFPQTETIEDITEFLEDYGTVEGVHLRRLNNPHAGSIFKGSLIASFSKLEEAAGFLQAPMVYYKDQQLEKMSKEEFQKTKEEERQASKGAKKRQQKEQEENEEGDVDLSFIHVTNLDDELINHIDMKNIFEQMELPAFKFFSRYEKNGPEGYIVYLNCEDRDNAMKTLLEKHEGGVITVKAADKVTFTSMPEDKLEMAEQSYKEFRQHMLNRGNNRRGGGRGGRGGRRGGGRGGNRNRSHGGGGRKNQHIKFGDNDNDEPAAKMVKTDE